jgi:NDP-sugar pyrophosphorylase family protein
MYPTTKRIPKVLLEVAGRPFVHWQLEWLASQSVTEIVYSIGHLGALIRDEVGDGSRWGVSVRYVDEGNRRLGTGGAVRLAVEQNALDDAFFVLYGDSYLSIDFISVESDFRERKPEALMVVYRNNGRWDRSNVVFVDGMVTLYQKGLIAPLDGMEFIDYGLSIIRARTIVETIPIETQMDIADLFGPLSRAGQLAGYEANERFFEIGSPGGLHELGAWLTNG